MSEALAIPDDADMFSDPDFARAIQERTKNRAKAFFHGPGYHRLEQLAGSPDDKTALSAITTIGKLAGEFKAPRPVALSFDELIKKAAAVPAGPLSNLTQIREAEAIDAEDADDDDTTE